MARQSAGMTDAAEVAAAVECGADAIDMAIRHVFTSPNVPDDNMEAANLVDTTQRVANGLHRIADALDRIADAMCRKGGLT